MPCEGLHPYWNRAGIGCQAGFPRLPACLFLIKVLWYLASLHGVFLPNITVQDPFSDLFSPGFLKNKKDFGLYVKHIVNVVADKSASKQKGKDFRI